MLRICFVCLGNICRSPTAEAVLARMLAESGLAGRVHLASAGTGDWHIGNGMDPRSLQALTERGYDHARHRAQQFVRSWFDQYDLVVAMDTANERALERLARDDADRAKIRLLRSYDAASLAAGDLDVPDPYYGGPDGFAHVVELVERACAGLLAEVREQVAP